jgi:hypothetical protein
VIGRKEHPKYKAKKVTKTYNKNHEFNHLSGFVKRNFNRYNRNGIVRKENGKKEIYKNNLASQ